MKSLTKFIMKNFGINKLRCITRIIKHWGLGVNSSIQPSINLGFDKQKTAI